MAVHNHKYMLSTTHLFQQLVKMQGKGTGKSFKCHTATLICRKCQQKVLSQNYRRHLNHPDASCSQCSLIQTVQMHPCSQCSLIQTAQMHPCSRCSLIQTIQMHPCSQCRLIQTAQMHPCIQCSLIQTAQMHPCGLILPNYSIIKK